MNEEFLKYLKVYEPESVIIQEGESTKEFYCLVQGSVGIWKGGQEEGSEPVKIDEISEPGSYFGEMSEMLGEERTASIIANKESVKVLQFPGEMLSSLVLKQPKLGWKICQSLASRLSEMTSKQQYLAQERNEIRDDSVAQFLHAREVFQKVFMMLTAVQKHLQQPNIKSIIHYMSKDKLMQGGKKVRLTDDFLSDMPPELLDPVKQAYSELV